jgi:tRNA(Ile)-lysidine synthase
MVNLQQQLKAALLQQLQHYPAGAARLVLAYSGGLDSQVLLHLLAPLCQELAIPLAAVHVHHGLNRQADNWATFCQAQCQQRQVDFSLRYVKLTQLSNIEQQARTARYQALAEFVNTRHTLLLTAHHADDQLETILLALKRGAGLTGLAAIPTVRAFAAGKLVRLLLGISRQQLLEYATAEQLTWLEDDSNQNIDFDRNFLRQQVTPTLKQRWPAILQTVSRSTQHLQHAAELANYYTEQALQQCLDNNRINLQLLNSFHPLQQDLVLRRWLSQENLNPEAQWLNTLKQQVINAKQDATPKLQLGNRQIRRYQHFLYLTSEQWVPDAGRYGVITLGMDRQLEHNLGCLCWHTKPTDLAMPIMANGAGFELAFGLLSARFKPAGLPSKPLKQWLKLWQVPPWQRNNIPLLLQESEIKVVLGFASSYLPEQATHWLSWQLAAPVAVYRHDGND